MPGAKKNISPEFIDSDSDTPNEDTSTTANLSSDEITTAITNSLQEGHNSGPVEGLKRLEGKEGRTVVKGASKKKANERKPAPGPQTLKFLLSILSAKELKKKEKDRVAASTFFELTSEEPFDTFVAQVLVRIGNLLAPKKLSIQEYNITYTIKHVESCKNSLKTEHDFTYLLECASTVEKPEIKVFVAQKTVKKTSKRTRKNSNSDGSSSADNAECSDNNDKSKSSKKNKSKARKKVNIDPANESTNYNIQSIKAKWACNKADCTSDFCWVSAENEAHVPLGNSHFNVSAAGMEMGEEFSTVRKPPNHSLFNGTPDERLGNMSSLLKKRLEDKKASGPTMPNITVNIPPITFPQPTSFAPLTTPISTNDPESLIPKDYLPGPKMTIDEFCTHFELDNKVRDYLVEEGYRSTASFAYAKIADLVDAGFKRGHISEMKVAISRWVVYNN